MRKSAAVEGALNSTGTLSLYFLFDLVGQEPWSVGQENQTLALRTLVERGCSWRREQGNPSLRGKQVLELLRGSTDCLDRHDTWVRFNKKISRPKIKGKIVSFSLKVSPLNIIYPGRKRHFSMKTHGGHYLNKMTKFNITSSNMYLHHVLPEIVQWEGHVTSLIFISKTHDFIVLIGIYQTNSKLRRFL